MNPITELISAAEKNVESKNYSLALEQLSAAEQIEPQNRSIAMIRDLVRSLQTEDPRPTTNPLSVTINRYSKTGIKEEPSSREIQQSIHTLTSSAQYFYSRGAVENAFESLMRAYLLDPIAPEVLACEKRILPAWKNLHGIPSQEVQTDWKASPISHAPKNQSSLFERLKSGKFFR